MDISVPENPVRSRTLSWKAERYDTPASHSTGPHAPFARSSLSQTVYSLRSRRSFGSAKPNISAPCVASKRVVHVVPGIAARHDYADRAFVAGQAQRGVQQVVVVRLRQLSRTAARHARRRRSGCRRRESHWPKPVRSARQPPPASIPSPARTPKTGWCCCPCARRYRPSRARIRRRRPAARRPCRATSGKLATSEPLIPAEPWSTDSAGTRNGEFGARQVGAVGDDAVDPAERPRAVERALRPLEQFDPFDVDQADVGIGRSIGQAGIVEQHGDGRLGSPAEGAVGDPAQEHAVAAGPLPRQRKAFDLCRHERAVAGARAAGAPRRAGRRPGRIGVLSSDNVRLVAVTRISWPIAARMRSSAAARRLARRSALIVSIRQAVGPTCRAT